MGLHLRAGKLCSGNNGFLEYIKNMNKILGVASAFFGFVWLIKTITWILRFLNGIGECFGFYNCDSLSNLLIAIIFSLFVYWGLKIGYELIIAPRQNSKTLRTTKRLAILYIVINLIFFFYLFSYLLNNPRVKYFIPS